MVFLVVLVVGVVEEGVTGSPSDFQQQVGGGTRLDMAAQAAAIIREKRKRLIPKIFHPLLLLNFFIFFFIG